MIRNFKDIDKPASLILSADSIPLFNSIEEKEKELTAW
jgi:hypothetical protein